MSDDSWYARPVFFVRNCEEALRFYGDLGFEEAWRHEEGGSIAAVQIDRSGAELILNQNGARAGGGRLFLSLEPGEVARIAESFCAAGVEVRDDYWGMPVKVVSDADGNDLLFFDEALVAS
jgi:catechol 2,3-dioxygenase-like lactoylglutathione lyase family enzyme